MRKVLFPLLVAFASLMMAGCEDPNSGNNGDNPGGDDPTVEAPVITLTAGEATMNTIEFTIKSEKATAVNYTVVSSNATRPSFDDIMANGTPLEPNTTQTIKTEGLYPGTKYIIMVAAVNDETPMAAPAVLEMVTVSDAYAVFDESSIKNVAGIWFGKCQEDVSDFIFIQVSTAELWQEGKSFGPMEGGKMLRLYFVVPKITDFNNVFLSPGEYKLDEVGGWNLYTINNYNSSFWEGTSENGADWTTHGLADAIVTVERDENGVYTFSGEFVVDNEDMSKVKFNYSGAIDIMDYSYGGFPPFTKDQVVYPSNMGGTYVSGAMMGQPQVDYMQLTFYNTPVDADGYVSGAGYVFAADIFTEARTYSTYEFAGTYVENTDGSYTAGTFLPGYLYTGLPMSTVLVRYGEESIVEAGLITTGTIVLTRADGNVTLEVDARTDRGTRVQVYYDGPETKLADLYGTGMTSVDENGVPVMIARHAEVKEIDEFGPTYPVK